ncbi:hypothetical protein VTP01DRAFT_7485 [Rhizomucor pusillus]|uniref:uncharacterized protein n=1 Tax=Rhizomucor pusillus TaxID=4840 RepID=UPI003742FACA
MYEAGEGPLFQETHYARYGQDRTNIYGTAVFKSRLPTVLQRSSEFPSDRFDSVPADQSLADKQLPLLDKPVRHLLAISMMDVNAFVSKDGYWNSLELNLGLESGKTEVIAVDIVELQETENDVYLIIALAVAEHQSDNEYKYSLWILGSSARARYCLEETLFHAKDACQRIQIPSAPMHLSHTFVQDQLAFFLTAMDGKIHMFMRERPSGEFNKVEEIRQYFPIMAKINQLNIRILYMHIYHHHNGETLICAGGQSGHLFLGIYNSRQREIAQYTTRIFSPITSVLLFQPRVSKTVHEDDQVHLVVTCAVEQALVYRSVSRYGLVKSRVLPLSGDHDSVLCSHAIDVDWDGQREIIIGTYGRQVIIYKEKAGSLDYEVLWRRQFAYPIYRITHLDLNLDGLDELIVATMYGIHILQPNMKKARERLLDVLQHVEANKRHISQLLLEWRHQKEMEKAVIFESQS